MTSIFFLLSQISFAACPDLTGRFDMSVGPNKRALEIVQEKCKQSVFQLWGIKPNGKLSDKPLTPAMLFIADGKFRALIPGQEFQAKAEFTANTMQVTPKDPIPVNQKCVVTTWDYSLTGANKDLSQTISIKCEGEKELRKQTNTHERLKAQRR